MAYMHVLREFAAGVMARLPTVCGLCEDTAQGGQLCQYCHQAVTHSMQGRALRCPKCRLLLEGRRECPDCKAYEPAFDGVIAAFDYAAPGDLLIHRLKVQRQFISAGMLAGLLADAVSVSGQALPAKQVLVPVPASRAALQRRGFNPAAEVAYGLAKRLQWPCRTDLLVRVREGQKQSYLGRAARISSAQSLYACAKSVQGLHIAVVDDVMTTGSTLHSVAQVLKAAGAASVWGMVLARTPSRPVVF